MDRIKITITAIASALLAYLEPIYAPIAVLGLVFLGDILAGSLVDILVNNDRLRVKKIMFAALFVALYASIIANTFMIGERLGDREEALFVVKTLTYMFAYFYVSNTLRNLCLLLPQNKPLAFLYYWLGLQVVKRLPDLARFLKLGTPKEIEE